MVTYCIPTYNRLLYLKQCLDSFIQGFENDDDTFPSVMNLGYTTIFTRDVAFIHYWAQDQDINLAINYDQIETQKQSNYLYKKWEKLELNLKEYLRRSTFKKKKAIFFTALCGKMYYSKHLKGLVEMNNNLSMELFDWFLEKAVVFKDKKYDDLKDFYLGQKYSDEIISSLK